MRVYKMMFRKGSKKKLLEAAFLSSFLFPNDNFINNLNIIGENHSHFSIHVSPDKFTLAISNSNYSTLSILDNETFSEVNISDINAFGCKWSPDSKKMLIMRSNFNDRKRKNSLIVLNKDGETYRTVINYTDKKIFPLGWTGENTFHFLLDNQLVTSNLKGERLEWDFPLGYAIGNKLYKKVNESDSKLIYEANDVILNLSYSKNALLLAFEVYGDQTLIIENDRFIIDDIKNGFYPKISPDGTLIVFMTLQDDGYRINKGDIYVWNSVTRIISPVANNMEKIEMNPHWINNEMIYFIDLENGSLNSAEVKLK